MDAYEAMERRITQEVGQALGNSAYDGSKLLNFRVRASRDGTFYVSVGHVYTRGANEYESEKVNVRMSKQSMKELRAALKAALDYAEDA